MSAEPRHGPVTMHRAVERALFRQLRAGPSEAPHAATAPSPAPGDDAPAADPGRAGSDRVAPPRGSRGGRPRLRHTGRGPR